MSRFFDLVSKPAREMSSYPQGAPPSQAETQPRLIKLDSNENPYGPSPLALNALKSALAKVHAYPDHDCGELRKRLAAHHGIPSEQILVTAGSTAVLGLFFHTPLWARLNAGASERAFIRSG